MDCRLSNHDRQPVICNTPCHPLQTLLHAFKQPCRKFRELAQWIILSSSTSNVEVCRCGDHYYRHFKKDTDVIDNFRATGPGCIHEFTKTIDVTVCLAIPARASKDCLREHIKQVSSMLAKGYISCKPTSKISLASGTRSSRCGWPSSGTTMRLT